LKVFEKVEITSIFETSEGKKVRAFTFDTSYVGYTDAPTDSTEPVGTKITLSGMRTEYADNVPKASISLAREFISHFLPILLSERQVEIVIDDEDQIRLTPLVRGELLIEKIQTEFALGSRSYR
jgi:hypothetical protein